MIAGQMMKQADIPSVHRILTAHYRRNNAPIVELVKVRGNAPFRILVATLLSARTRDTVTSHVCQRLFAEVHSPDDLARLSTRQIEQLIYPVGFHHTKARHLKRLARQIISQHHRRVPDTLEGLTQLPGVGRKTANLVLIAAFNKPAVCVDVHVHRISNRLGLIRTRTPVETELVLRRILPIRYWKTWNHNLVSLGQTVCGPRRPRCEICPVLRFCSRVGLNSRLTT